MIRYAIENNRIAHDYLVNYTNAAFIVKEGFKLPEDGLYSGFDAVVLLSAPVEVLIHRIESRTTNGYGKSAEDRALILRHVAEVEPLLRATCTHEIDAAQQIGEVVAQLVEIGSRR